jgi:mRNA-degrading endonuclease toxin of MazEF toxin-antitoxin module
MSIIVIPVASSAVKAKRGPTIVGFPAGAAGLPRPSVAVCHQVTTLDRAKLTRKIGALPVDLLQEVDKALKAAMDLD